ncbi:MAG: hypothetical protein FWF37_01775 [Chloroflexi bacterium]|nr:hypothetical protein [Chloroflexota bacterium]
MAERRMLANKIIDSDLFLDMPATAQLLYFHLLLKADDEGFIASPKSIMRIIGAKDDDIRILIAKQFLITFNSGVVVIRHWRIHNYIQSDRFHPTVHQTEKQALNTDNTKAYIVDNMDTNCIPNVSIVDTEVREGKVSLGKVREDKSKTPNGVVKGTVYSKTFEEFWALYPNKQKKAETYQVWQQIDQSLIHKILEVLPRAKLCREWLKEEGRFIPHPKTWLNQKRWEDDYQPYNPYGKYQDHSILFKDFSKLSPTEKNLYMQKLEALNDQRGHQEHLNLTANYEPDLFSHDDT